MVIHNTVKIRVDEKHVVYATATDNKWRHQTINTNTTIADSRHIITRVSLARNIDFRMLPFGCAYIYNMLTIQYI